MNSKVRVRIAPSPTGFAHVGTAYTALFNYAFARKNKGKFVVRVEDTDVKRHVKGAEEAIHQGLAWLGLSWDESTDVGGKYAPYRQSERLELYQEKAHQLLEKGLAYRDDQALRFKNPGEDFSFRDLIKGDISFPGDQVTDFVIIKSDGYPTYNFAVVIDDIKMRITHVIRGEEHVSNTPRQLALYRALGVKPPVFAHHPTLRNKEHKKLSKRRDPVDLRLYQKKGYLPEALVNFLCLLGWSHPREKEIFSLEEFVDLFSLNRVRRAGPIFDTKKLDWINGVYLRLLSVNELNSLFVADNPQFRTLEKETQLKITTLVQSRIKTLSELDSLAGFFFEKPQVDRTTLGNNYQKHLSTAQNVLQTLAKWDQESIDKSLLKLIKDKGYKTGDFFMDLRIAVTGSKFTPPINDSIVILGKKETLARLNSCLA